MIGRIMDGRSIDRDDAGALGVFAAGRRRVLDGDLRVQSVNPAFFEAFGCPQEETKDRAPPGGCPAEILIGAHCHRRTFWS
jgi:hypothetical protein